LAKDPRISAHLYDPAHIVTVHGKVGIQSTIQFGEDEHIDNIAVGDSSAWQVTPNKRASLVFVKPMQPATHTNMTVVTDRRTYLFDLIARPGVTPVYAMRFSYPPEAPKPVAGAATLLPAEAELAHQIAAKEPEKTPADLHFNWAMAGSKQLLPTRLFDDGKATWLTWPRDAGMPAILSREANGEEGPVNYRVEGEYVVVDGIPAQIVLRQGKLSATLTPAPRPAQPEKAEPVGQTASAQP
jgi:type IV secretion system protein VirB9